MIWLVVLGMALTVGVLLLGVGTMVAGKETSLKYGNRLMVARVALQFITILLLVLVVFLR